MKKSVLLSALSLILLLFSCKKEDEFGHIHLNLSYKVDGNTVSRDSFSHTNEAGHLYPVSRLLYYISEIVLTDENNETFTIPGPFYVDMDSSVMNTIELDDVPRADYKSIRFYIGLNPSLNVTDVLPATTNNINMAWPDPMGGGYHFMKFEGYYLQGGTSQTGFAMHLGKNANLVTCTVNDIGLTMDEHGGDLNLEMNLNEWFRNPNTYNFDTDGVSIMMNDASMLKIAQNGADVFKKKL